MPKNLRALRATAAVVCAVLSLAFFLALAAIPAAAQSPDLVISQVYGGGGNSGAVYRNDFVELFNRGAVPVSLLGKSIQYASGLGTGNFGANSGLITGLPNVTLAPGQYYLVQEVSGGSSGILLPAPDYTTGTINMGAAAGKVALVNSTTGLGCNGGSNPCSADQAAKIIDLIGYGGPGGANYFEGSVGPALSNILAAFRANGGCTDTNNNGADFAAQTPNPRNTASTTNVCAVSLPPSVAPAVTPNSVEAGQTALLTARPSPGSNPTDTSLTVSADLSGIDVGNSKTQLLFDDGSHGDAAASDGLFSYQITVPTDASAGVYHIDVIVKDGQNRVGSATVALTVIAPIAAAIHDIQGPGSISPLNGSYVLTNGIVTQLAYNGFYLQSPESEYDGNDATSEGIFIYTGGKPAVQSGDKVQVKGHVSEYPSSSAFPTTEITDPVVAILDHGQPLPAVIDIAPAPTSAVGDFERYEGMLVRLVSPKVVGPSGAAGAKTDGTFYVTAADVPRPFREPGIAPGAPDVGFPINVPHFDGNPERVRVDSSACDTPATAAAGDSVAEISGALSYYYGDLAVYGCPSVNNITFAQPLPERVAGEFTVGTFNMLNFTSDTTRLTKASLAIRNIMRMPDIIGLEEVDTLATVQALAGQINSDAVAAGQGNPGYLGDMKATAGTQNLGVLYRDGRVTNVLVNEVGTDATFVDPRDGSIDPVNDRPPLVMTANIHVPGEEFPVTIIVNHLRSLIDVDTLGGKGDFARYKRRACAEFLANLIATHQAAGENVISVGDYNAFEFNDGYVDVLGTVIGNPADDTHVLLWSSDLVTPDAVDTITSLPAGARYSYVENGSAQDLDHIVVSAGLLDRPFHLEIAHNNADFPKVLGNDATRPERVSDHDMPVGYFTLPYVFSGFLNLKTSGINPGSTVPLKFQLKNGSGGLITATTAIQSIRWASNSHCAGAPDGTAFTAAAAGGSTLRFDLTAGQFIFNWQTPRTAGGCYNILLRLDDGTTRSAIVSFK